MKTKLVPRLLASSLFVVSAFALAHGDEDDSSTRKAYDARGVEIRTFGQEGDPKNVTRTVKISMDDTMRFSPAEVTVKRGETTKFVVHNNGKVLHEMVLGTRPELKEHAELMKKFPEMVHSASNMTHVKPNTDGEIVWQFTKAGEFEFACLIPGHFEAGMVGKVTVK